MYHKQQPRNQPIPPGQLRNSVFSQIDPSFFLTKFHGAERRPFPFKCALTGDVIRTPVINRACGDACYFSGQALIDVLDNMLTSYCCPNCGKGVHSKDLLFDAGFDHHLNSFDNTRNKSVINDSFFIDSNGLQSAHEQTDTIDIIGDRFDKMRESLLFSLLNTSQGNSNAGICIDHNSIAHGFRLTCQQYNIKQARERIEVCRGRKNQNDTVFTTLLILRKGEFLHMNMTIKGETYFMPKESEVFMNHSLGAFFIVAAHKNKLCVLRGFLAEIQIDTIHFIEIASLEKRQFFAVACDGTNIYVMGGINMDNYKTYKEAYNINCKTGNVSRLPDMSSERCGVKAQICGERLYLIGGASCNATRNFTLTDFNEYFNLRANKWERFATGSLMGYNFAVLLTRNPSHMIVYGGSSDPAYENQFKKYYLFDCKANQAMLLGEVKEVGKLEFDFDNTATSSTLIRSLKGNRHDVVLLRFMENGSYEYTKKQLM